MNSSDFENMSSNFSFNSPSVPRSGLVFAKSRVSKRRSINRSNLKPENQAAPGVNPFHLADSTYSSFPLPAEGAFNAAKVGSVSIDPIGGLREGVTDEMKNLKIRGEGEPVGAASDLNAKLTFESRGGNHVGSRFSKDEVAASNLTDDMMRKLNIEGLPVDKSYTNVKAGACVNDGSKLSQAQLPLELEKLNIKGSTEFGGEKVETSARAQNMRTDNVNLKITTNSSSIPGNYGGVTENVLLNEVEKKLNLGDDTKCSSSKTDPLKFGYPAAPSFAFTTGENLPKKDGTNFSSRLTDAGTPFSGFTTPASKVSLVSGVGQKLEFGARRDTVNSSKLKKKGKPRQPSYVPPQPIVQEYAMSGNSPLENPEASDAYSPMDVSPYRENVVDDRSLREASVTSSESFSLDSKTAPTNSQVTGPDDPLDEDLVAATQRMEINSDDNYIELNDEPPMKNPYDEYVSAADTESFKTAPDELDPVRDDCVTSSEKNEVSCSSNFERQGSVGKAHYGFGPHPDETIGSNFTFSASTSSSSSRAQIPVLKRNSKKKNSNKSGHPSYSVEIPYASPSSILSFSTATTSPLMSPHFERGSQPLSQQRGNESRINTGQDSNPESSSHKAVAASIAAQEACEKWRLRGNQAYASGDMSKAEEWYTQGINSISRDEMSRSCLRALMLCLSNRAATRMSLGRMRDALEDCLRATEIDPNFFRVQVRAANCHLALGEIEDALQWYRKCLQAGGDILADRKIAVEASEGIQKAQKVSDCTNHSTQLLMSRTSQDAETALEIIAEALTISVYSEKLIEMKAQTLFMLLHRYQEVIQLCEQTLNSAEKNSPSIDANESPANSGSSRFTKRFQFLSWRCSLILKSYFHMGKLEEGLSSVEKLWEQFSVANCSGSSSLESLIPLVKTMRELIHLKVAGNEAFQAGKHAEAIEQYTAALSYNAESRPFAAICFCNRAAAYKAMGQISDAIADCSLAIALDGNYQKAISRRATLYEMIRDYDQAAADLQRLISILNKQVDEKMAQGGYDRSLSCANELRRIRLHLSEIEEEAKKGFQLDLYLILGVDSTVSILEIKKAYRKLALRHHPDKACQFLAKGDNGDETLWKGIAEEVHKDADRLFKMIGEAYAILSDSVKRARYDLDEETRNAMKRRNEASSFRTTRDEQYYPFDRSSSTRHQPREVWRTQTDSQPRRAESNRWTRYK